MNAVARFCSPAWLRLAFLLVGVGLSSGHVAAVEWPENYVTAEDTTSPDGRYGVLIPAEDAEGDPVNYLADLREERILGAIKGFEYYEHQVHGSLRVLWNADSKWCVAEFGDHSRFVSIAVLELSGSGFTQVEIGSHIQKALDAPIVRQTRNRKSRGDGDMRYRLGPGRTLRVRASATTNPKQREYIPTFCAEFAGTFDLKAKRWLSSSARPVSAKDEEAMGTAYTEYHPEGFLIVPEGKEMPEGYRGETYRTDADQAERLDAILNDVYRIVRLTLPPARFAAVKAEQVAWLKRRDALPSAPEKAKLTFARIKALQDLVW